MKRNIEDHVKSLAGRPEVVPVAQLLELVKVVGERLPDLRRELEDLEEELDEFSSCDVFPGDVDVALKRATSALNKIGVEL